LIRGRGVFSSLFLRPHLTKEAIMSKFSEVLSVKKFSTLQEKIKEALDEESYKDFLEAMKNPAITAPSIARALKDFGIEISPTSLARWRTK
jgi:hypothetical protein